MTATSQEVLVPNFLEDVFYNYSQSKYKKIGIDSPRFANWDWQRWDAVYRGFRIQRLSRENSHVHIISLDGSPAPDALRSSFTSWSRAEAEIDKYISFMNAKANNNDTERPTL